MGSIEVYDNIKRQWKPYVPGYEKWIHNEMEIKDTTDCSTSTLYLDILVKLDVNGKLTTQLYDRRNFSIVIFSYLCSNDPISPIMVFISRS
jgi:hypothetical protein